LIVEEGRRAKRGRMSAGWIFNLLPDDLFQWIIGEWLEYAEDVGAFDSAICVKSFRQHRLSNCLKRLQATKFTAQSSSGLNGLINWQQTRKVNIRRLHLLFHGNSKKSNDNLQFSRIHWKALDSLQNLSLQFTNDKSEVRFDIHTFLSSLKKLLKLQIKNEFISSIEITNNTHAQPLVHPLTELDLEYVTIREKNTREILDWFVCSCTALHILRLECCTNVTHRLFLSTIQRLPLLVDIEYTNIEEDEDDGNEYDDDDEDDENFEDVEESDDADDVDDENGEELESDEDEVTEGTTTINPSRYIKRVRLDTSMSISMLVKVLQYCTSPVLEFLKIPMCDFDDTSRCVNEYAILKLQLIPAWTRLHTLELYGGVSDGLFHTICSNCGPSLCAIKLQSETDFDDQSMVIIAQNLIHLESLQLIRCMHITDQGIRTLCEAAKTLHQSSSGTLFALKKITLLDCEGLSASSYHLLLDTFQKTLTAIAFKGGQVNVSVFERLLLQDTTEDTKKEDWTQVEELELWLADILQDLIIGYRNDQETIRFRSWPKLRMLEVGYCRMLMNQFQQLLRGAPKLQIFEGLGLLFMRDWEHVYQAQKARSNKRAQPRKRIKVEGIKDIRQFAEEGMEYYENEI
jgi:hypothetical protein